MALSLVYGPPLTSIHDCRVLESRKVTLNPEEEAPALIYPVINPSPTSSKAQPDCALGHASKGLASNCPWAFALSVPSAWKTYLFSFFFFFFFYIGAELVYSFVFCVQKKDSVMHICIGLAKKFIHVFS